VGVVDNNLKGELKMESKDFFEKIDDVIINYQKRPVQNIKSDSKLFEIGKYYKHHTGITVKILCEAETKMRGNTFIAEKSGSMYHELISVGNNIEYDVHWTEVTEEEFNEKEDANILPLPEPSAWFSE